MLQQRIEVDSEIRENELRRYFYFCDIFLSRTMIPLALAGVIIAPMMIFAGGTGPYVGAGLLLIILIYALSYPWRCRKFMERNQHEIGRRNHIIVDKRMGIVVDECSIHNIEEFSWQQVVCTGENKNLFVFSLPTAACYIPKADLNDEQIDFISRICASKKGVKHKKV